MDVDRVARLQADEIRRHRRERENVQVTVARPAPLVRPGSVAIVHKPAEPGTPSERQRQVLALVCDGLQNAEIGREMFLAEETIKSHVRALLAISGSRNRAHLVAWAFREGFVR